MADGPEGVEVRRGEADDLEPALSLYHATFPEGVFPDDAWRDGLAKGSVYLAERERHAARVPQRRPERPLGLPDRGHRPGALARRRRFLLSRVLQDYWTEHPGEILGLSVEADNLPALRLLRRQGFAPWLVLQSYELWL